MTEGYIFKEDELALVHELDEIRGEVRQLKARESELRERILEMLQSQTRGLTASGSQVVTIQIQNRRSVNSAKLEALYPEVYDAVVEEKTATVLKLG